MKLITVVSTLDLKYRLGCTPAWWQLLKALNETGHEIIAIPYLGKAMETIWWRCYPNAWRLPGEAFFLVTRKILRGASQGFFRRQESIVRSLTNVTTLPVWRNHLRRILKVEKDVDAVMFMNVPLNQIAGIPTAIKNEAGVKTVFFDGDMPTILPEHSSGRGFMFDYYEGATLEEYDLFLTNSEGVASNLKDRGAKNVRPVHYAADPEFFKPVAVEKSCDVAFFGYGSQTREKWMTKMIAEPSRRISNSRFLVGGNGFTVPLGSAEQVGDIPMSAFPEFCSRSKINLNITRESHTHVLASSTARPFELAAMGCCVVSCPYNGLDKWFKPEEEILILSEKDDVTEIYNSLLSDETRMRNMGDRARRRVLADHTYAKRATQITNYLREA